MPGIRRDDEDDLAAPLEHLGLAPANLVGNSFGASIALALAARRPDLVRSVCVHEPPLLGLCADDPFVRAASDSIYESVLPLIERGEESAAAAGLRQRRRAGPGCVGSLPA